MVRTVGAHRLWSDGNFAVGALRAEPSSMPSI
jgi:hypothetical protein